MADKISVAGGTRRRLELEGSARLRFEQLREAALPSISLIKTLREQLDLSQADIAEILGVSQPSISQLESRRDLRLSVLSRIVAAQGGAVRVIIDMEDGRSIELKA
jgi:DNA-binding XRE family transcriptional regulator